MYANKNYKKGDLVYSAEHCACFEDGDSFRYFLASIPPTLGCEVLQWSYSAKSFGVCVDLDEGSLVNHASKSLKHRSRGYAFTRELPNIKGSIAIADINIGDEILVDYDDFDEPSSWADLGLGVWKADLDVSDEEVEHEDLIDEL